MKQEDVEDKESDVGEEEKFEASAHQSVSAIADEEEESSPGNYPKRKQEVYSKFKSLRKLQGSRHEQLRSIDTQIKAASKDPATSINNLYGHLSAICRRKESCLQNNSL